MDVTGTGTIIMRTPRQLKFNEAKHGGTLSPNTYRLTVVPNKQAVNNLTL